MPSQPKRGKSSARSKRNSRSRRSQTARLPVTSSTSLKTLKWVPLAPNASPVGSVDDEVAAIIGRLYGMSGLDDQADFTPVVVLRAIEKRMRTWSAALEWISQCQPGPSTEIARRAYLEGLVPSWMVK